MEDTVYLTAAYAAHFAIAASGSTGTAGVILEVDTCKLDEEKMVPDEDLFVAELQAGMLRETHTDVRAFVKRHFDELIHVITWEEALSYLGTCGYRGVVPVSAVRRIAVIDMIKNPRVGMWLSDTAISPIGYAAMGHSLKIDLEWLMDGAEGVRPNPYEELIGSASMLASMNEGRARASEELRKVLTIYDAETAAMQIFARTS